MKKRRRAYKKYDWRDHKVLNYIKNNPVNVPLCVFDYMTPKHKRIIDAFNSMAEIFFGNTEKWQEERNEEKIDRSENSYNCYF